MGRCFFKADKWKLIVYRFQLQPDILKRAFTKTIATWIAKAGFVVKI